MISFILFFLKYFRHTKVDGESEKMHENNLSLFWFVTILVMISSLIPKLVSYICLLYSCHNKNEAILREQLTVLKAQLREVNMMDQFAKHAKIQRKINKIQDELSDKSMSKNFFEIKLRLFSYVVLYTVTGIVMLYISWTYKYVPLLVLDPKLFYPFGSIIAFPTGIEGAIGIVPWISICSIISKNLIEFLSVKHQPIETISDTDTLIN